MAVRDAEGRSTLEARRRWRSGNRRLALALGLVALGFYAMAIVFGPH